ncbi:hypothetical protein Tco_0448636 [Tanacetum coccineum]
MLAQPTEDEGAVLESPYETQPTPSPTHPSEDQSEPQPDPFLRPSSSNPIPDSILEGSGRNHGGQPSSDRSLSGNENGLTLQSVYDLYCHKDLAFDDLDDAMDYMETEDAHDEGIVKDSKETRVSTEDQVSTDKPNKCTGEIKNSEKGLGGSWEVEEEKKNLAEEKKPTNSCIHLMSGYRHAQLNKKKFEEIQVMYEKVSEEPKTTKVKAKIKEPKENIRKRSERRLKMKALKRSKSQKTDSNQEEENQLRTFLKIVPEEEEEEKILLLNSGTREYDEPLEKNLRSEVKPSEFWIFYENMDVHPNQHDDVLVVLELVLEDEDEDPEEGEFKEEEDPQEDEDDMEIDIEEDENEPELTYPYEEVDPLNPPPPASESEPNNEIDVENPIKHEGETIPVSIYEVGESSTTAIPREDGDKLLPGFMRRDIDSF